MRILFVLDDLDRLDPEWDSSLMLLREFCARGYQSWTADTPDIWAESNQVWASATRLKPKAEFKYEEGQKRQIRLRDFDFILIRKEPPFDAEYLYLTYLVEQVVRYVPVSNHPGGIRSSNEKLSILNFQRWIPETLVSNSAEQILNFRQKIGRDLVIKPLDQKGGTGVQLLPKEGPLALSVLDKVTGRGRQRILAQQFLEHPSVKGDKRILVLDGKILTAYDKRFKHGEFRANLGLGATFHKCPITPTDHRLVKAMVPYLKEQGLHLVGIDVMMGKLIEVNVTCPAGIAEAQSLYEDNSLIGKWADFLEGLKSS